MNEHEYNNWKYDARLALMAGGKYSLREANIIVDWFDDIDTKKEINLVTEGTIDQLLCIFGKHFDLYASLMIRLWVYAPYILKEAK